MTFSSGYTGKTYIAFHRSYGDDWRIVSHEGEGTERDKPIHLHLGHSDWSRYSRPRWQIQRKLKIHFIIQFSLSKSSCSYHICIIWYMHYKLYNINININYIIIHQWLWSVYIFITLLRFHADPHLMAISAYLINLFFRVYCMFLICTWWYLRLYQCNDNPATCEIYLVVG